MQSQSTRRIDRVCETCGAAFTAQPGLVAKGLARFCTRRCLVDSRDLPGTIAVRLAARTTTQGECWVVDGTEGGGYGQFMIRRQNILAHRVAWELASGEPIPDGMEVLHTCDNRPCVRNDDKGIYEVRGKILPRFGHLALGTAADNSADMVDKDRSPRGERNRSYKYPESVVRGSAHYETHLTEDDVRYIRSAYVRRKVTAKMLAAHYNVSREAISRIVNRDTWKHVT